MAVLDHHDSHGHPDTDSAVLPVCKFALVWVGLLALAFVINTAVTALL